MLASRTRSVLVSLLMVGAELSAQTVVQCPTQSAPLQERWSWARGEGVRSARGSAFWIGYCVKRLMEEDSYIGSREIHSGSVLTGRPSLYELLSGERSASEQQGSGWRYGDESNLVKNMKDVALLFQLTQTREGGVSITAIILSSMELHVDLHGMQLLWLGGSEDDASVTLLKSLFGEVSSASLKAQLVRAVGIHQRSVEAFPFLKLVLKDEDDNGVRAQAAFWLGEQNNSDALKLLVEAARNDRAVKVREESVFAVSRISSDESTDTLIDLALKTSDPKVRAKAAFWLGEKASEKAVKTLEGIVADDEETDVQRQALYALARIHDNEGVDRLIRIAKTHPNPRIRKQAIQCLGQSDDPKTLDALIEIVRK